MPKSEVISEQITASYKESTLPRLMYDSVTPPNCPGDAPMYAGYVDGRYSNMAWLSQAHPGKLYVPISALGINLAPVVDVEPGCVWPPANAVPWVRRARAAGYEPTVYCGRANWPLVIAAFQAAGEPEPHWWTAHYTNSPHFCSSSCYGSSVGGRVSIATQFGGDLAGGYDINVVADHWPGVDSGIAPSGGGTIIGGGTDISGGITKEEGFLMALSDAEQQQLYDRVNLLFDVFGGQVRDPLASLVAGQSEFPFKLYGDGDEGSSSFGQVWLMRPGFTWYVPNPDYLALLQSFRLAGAVINVTGGGDGNVFAFIKGLFESAGGSNSADVSALAARIDALTASIDPAKIVADIKAGLPDLDDDATPEEIAQAVLKATAEQYNK